MDVIKSKLQKEPLLICMEDLKISLIAHLKGEETTGLIKRLIELQEKEIDLRANGPQKGRSNWTPY